MKNFRVLLLVIGGIFVSTQQAQANVKELTKKLTTLQEKLNALSTALKPTKKMIQDQADKMSKEQAKQAYEKSVEKFPGLITAINDAKDENATLPARKTLFDEQRNSLIYMEAYLKASSGDKEVSYMLNEAIKWAVVAEAAWSQAGQGFFGASPTKNANSKTYKDLVYKRFTQALDKLYTLAPNEVEELQKTLSWKIPEDGADYLTKYGKDTDQRYVAKIDITAGETARKKVLELINTFLETKKKKA